MSDYPYLCFDGDYVIDDGKPHYILSVYSKKCSAIFKLIVGKYRYSHIRKIMEDNNLDFYKFPAKTCFYHTDADFCNKRVEELNAWIKNVQSINQDAKQILFTAFNLDVNNISGGDIILF